MRKYIIDTNALISFITDRNVGQQEKIARLFDAASHLRCTILCHQHVLTEFVFVMDKVYRVEKAKINAMVRDFIALPGIDIRHEIDFSTLLSLWPAFIPDFGDAIIVALGKSIKGTTIATFDGKLLTILKNLGMATYEA